MPRQFKKIQLENTNAYTREYRGKDFSRYAVKKGNITAGTEKTKDQIRNIVFENIVILVKKYKKSFKNIELRFYVSLKYTEPGTPLTWISAKSFSGDDVKTPNDVKIPTMADYDPTNPDYYKDQDTFTHAVLYVKPIQREGGYSSDDNNDCLYNELKQIVINYKDYIGSSAAIFKKRLGLSRKDAVDVELLSKVDDMMPHLRLQVDGDSSYISPKSKGVNIYVRFEKGHFKQHPKYSERYDRKLYKLSVKEKDFIIYRKKFDYVEYCDGKNVVETNKDDFRKFYETHHCYRVEFSSKSTLQENYNKIVQGFKEIKELSDGEINLFKNGHESTTALALFRNKTLFRDIPDEIALNECLYIDNATCGSVQYFEPFEGQAYEYDFNSFYPAMMLNNKFPMKEGEFKYISELPEKLEYGIYKCKITNNIKNKQSKLFKINRNHYYTHADIHTARKLGLDIEMIENNQSNALVWSEDKLISGHYLFKNMFDYLYDFKNKVQDNKFLKKTVKTIINSCWGVLSEANTIKLTVDDNGEAFDLHDDKEYEEFCPMNDEATLHKVKLRNLRKSYRFDYARIKPFVLSFGRQNIINKSLKYIDSIVRIHTDSIISHIPLDIEHSDDIGKLKVEAPYHIKIGTKHVNDCVKTKIN